MTQDKRSINYKHLLYSAFGTSLAEIITLPICTIKTNYQNNNSNSIIRTTKDIYNSGGYKAFWKASTPGIISQTISTSSKYFIYRNLEDKKIKYYPFPEVEMWNKFINGLCAGVVSTVFTHPVDHFKIHLQMSQSVSTIVENIKNSEEGGFKRLYRGYSKSITKVLFSSGFFFPLFEFYKEKTNSAVISSALSAFTSTIIMHPIDYLKTRHIYGQKLFQGLNPLIYYRGLGLNLLRIVPHFCIVMTTVDYLQNLHK
ncbi:Mitochondrial carrier protein [Orpheovirus IHUMI-LCC2]|uniref:Mitochondrial carrier protein n=1 Tax=Orpheovirus IHUMI-LCC2 TaxID=2023057 RepID=A0A2I2L421_9VIRU|nr:Mitochondrial carrier protein [Orpheovirus IHUMI-LCC2]SNW62260.1 Mitochondrial carrier protein [Orpheovirus IHUMI-LCC2]